MEMEKEPQSKVQQEAQTEVPESEIEIPETKYTEPTGAFTFVILVLIFYAIYWTISWFEVFVIRGA